MTSRNLVRRATLQQKRRRRRRHDRARLLGASGAVASLLLAAAALAAPADILETAGDISSWRAPEGTTISVGEGKVSSKTGSFDYSIPIVVPPGRVGAQPSLALTYSSQAPIYGDIAAGWTFNLPVIYRDYSDGRVGPERWISSMSGRELVTTSEPSLSSAHTSYRARGDSSYARYQRSSNGGGWTVLQSDGSMMFFGIPGANPFDDSFPLVQTTDRFGNEVSYHWEEVVEGGQVLELRLAYIQYGQALYAGLNPHAQVVFSYGTPTSCAAGAPPVGSSISYRSGEKRVTGAAPLVSVTTRVALDASGTSFRDVRRYDLSYAEAAMSCSSFSRAHDSPSRQLESIIESARSPEGVWSSMPPISFAYGGARQLSSPFDRSSALSPATFLPGGTFGDFTSPLGDAPDHLMVDMDGDGLKDLVEVAASPPGDPRCRIGWSKNLGEQPDGTMAFDAPVSVPMPTVPWKNHDGWGGGGTFEENNLGTPGPGESCTVVGQHTLESDYYGSNEDDECVGGQAPCGAPPGPDYVGALLLYQYEDFNRDGLTDLVVGMEIDENYYAHPTYAGSQLFASCPSGRFQIQIRGPQSFYLSPNDPPLTPPTGALPDTAPTSGLKPYSPCNSTSGDYGWNLYANDGTGHFSPLVPFGQTAGFVADAPVSKQVGETYPALGGGELMGQTAGLSDLDGDGFLDGIRVKDFKLYTGPGATPGATELPWEFWVSRWDQSTSAFDDPSLWAKETTGHPEAIFPASRRAGDPGSGWSVVLETSRLVDVHGDGLPDLLEFRPSIPGATLFEVRPNHGAPDASGWGFGAPAAPGPENEISRAFVSQPQAGVYTRTQKATLKDLDNDGRVDLVTPTTIHWGLGEGWLQRSGTIEPQEVSIGFQPSGGGPKRWAVEVDWIDVNGDGLPERVERYNASGDERTYFYDLPAHGARRAILHSINNGRGLTVDVSYAPHVADSVVTIGGGKLPSPTWVVASVKTTHAHPSTVVGTVSYHYNEPVWNQDEDGRWGFRGFKSVVSTGPSGASVEERFGYDIDWSGRLTTTLTAASPGAKPNSIVDTTWTAFPVQGVTTFQTTQTREYVCEFENASGNPAVHSEADCREQTTPLVSAFSFDPRVDPGVGAVAYVLGQTIVGELEAGAFKRAICASSSYDQRYSGWQYRFVETATIKTAGDSPGLPGFCSGGGQCLCPEPIVGASATAYDTQLVAPLHTCSIRNASETPTPGSGVCTRLDIDPLTGLVLREQTAEGFFHDVDNSLNWETGVTTTTYDSFSLYPAQVENALDHVVSMTTDLGTGVQIGAYGPNPNQGGYQEIDGFGRMLHEWISIKDDPDPNQPYHYRRRRDIAYTDGSPSFMVHRPTRLLSTEETLESESNAQWAEIKTTYDGAGRVIEVFENAFGNPVEVTSTRTHNYDSHGNLASVTVPDPSKAKYVTGDVTSTFEYDSLGRKTCALAPNGSGVATVYAGRVISTFEFGSDGGDCTNPTDLGITTPRAASKVRTDPRGRVVEVHERVNAVANTWSTTLYTYDGNSNPATITREDDSAYGDIVTTLTHDLVGNRTQLDRHGRTWSYTYDHNGQMLTEVSPAAGGAFTISVLYDQLGRPTHRLVPDGSLSGPEAAELGVGQTTFEYDQGTYGLGHLTRKTSPVETIDYTYDARGNPHLTTRSINLSSPTGANIPLTDSLVLNNLSWNAFDQPATVIHPSGQRTFTFYHRWPSSPKHVYVYMDDGMNEYFLNSRNAAGVVKKMLHLKSETGVGSHYGRNEFFGYDKLGRLTHHYSGDTGDDKISQIASYYGTSEVATLESQVGPVSGKRNFNFTYDDQHQLVDSSDDKGYHGAFSFTKTGRLLSANVSANPGPGTMVENRRVEYSYADSDPEILTSLDAVDEVGDPDPLGLSVNYDYDAAGNMTERDVTNGGGLAGTSVELIYDAENRLRIRRLPTGAEERYFYEGPNRWLAVQVGTNGSATGARVWFGDEEIEYVCAPTCVRKVEKSYVRLGGRTVARVDRDATTGVAESKVVHANGLGHTLGVYSYSFDGTSLTYNLELGFQYGPFGEILDTFEAPGADADTYRERFNGKELDTASGLSYYGYRYFDSLGLIWNRSDPLYRFAPDRREGPTRTANLYSFSSNNPVRFVDPDGLESKEAVTLVIIVHPRANIADARSTYRSDRLDRAIARVQANFEKATGTRLRVVVFPGTAADLPSEPRTWVSQNPTKENKPASNATYLYIVPRIGSRKEIRRAVGKAMPKPVEARVDAAIRSVEDGVGGGITPAVGTGVGILADAAIEGPDATDGSAYNGVYHEGVLHPSTLRDNRTQCGSQSEYQMCSAYRGEVLKKKEQEALIENVNGRRSERPSP